MSTGAPTAPGSMRNCGPPFRPRSVRALVGRPPRPQEQARIRGGWFRPGSRLLERAATRVGQTAVQLELQNRMTLMRLQLPVRSPWPFNVP
jgi:hypothetical protein